MGELGLDLLKGGLGLRVPLEGKTLDHFAHKGHDWAKVLYKPPIERGKSMKTSYIVDAFGPGPRPNGLNLPDIYTDPMGSHNIPYEGHLI